MPEISTQEFERLPLRVHEFLAGVPLTTCGQSICRIPVPASHWMSSCRRHLCVGVRSGHSRVRS